VKHRVVITRIIPEAGLALLRRSGIDLRVRSDDDIPSPGELPELVRDCDAILATLYERIDDTVLDAAGPRLRIVANFGVGYDNIDVPAATRRGVIVTNTPDVLTDATADLTWALILATARRVVEGDALVRSGKWCGWRPSQLLGVDVAGATLGVIGSGRIGTAVARRAVGFAMRLLYVARRDNEGMEALGARRVSLEDCLRESDFVSLHVPLTEETRGMLSAERLALMKPTACLINTARGPIIDEEALIDCLEQGRLRAAGLDVYADEPRVPERLVRLPNVVLLPHIGSATEDTRAKMAMIAARCVIDALEGRRPAHIVNPEAVKRRGVNAPEEEA
jgi:glyoxylate reductase